MADNRRRSPPAQPYPKRRAMHDLRNRMTGGNGGNGGNRNGQPAERRQQQSTNVPTRSDFTFSSDIRGPQFPPAGPAGPPAERSARRGRGRGRGASSGRNNARPPPPRNDDGGSVSHNRGRRNKPFGRGRFQAPHERALLQNRDDSTEHFLGVDTESKKFRDLADLSDDEEADMDTDSEGSDSSQVKTKLVRTVSSTRADGDSIPKWSNPDPYTVLPPPEETTGKRLDVVKLIRKAKNEVAQQKEAASAVVDNDDFISFGDEDAQEESVPMQGSLNDVGLATPQLDFKEVQHHIDIVGLGTRPAGSSTKRKRPLPVGSLSAPWQPLSSSTLSLTPWTRGDDFERLRHNPIGFFHNEILDFYHYVKPTDENHRKRQDVITRVEWAMGKRLFAPDVGGIRCFGSYPKSLYLPTADMDLVYVSDKYLNGGPPVLLNKPAKIMRAAARNLLDRGIAIQYPLVIAKARVPILKFKESFTGLPVDISFENLSGLVAQDTMSRWLEQFPEHMVYLVAIIKQFLAMRDLNEVASGGLGGLSTICLVVSFLQLHNVPDNLGEALLQFFDFYGNRFNLARDRIVMDPPEIKRKDRFGIDGREEKHDRLSIQDPNNPQNNISGGSSSVRQIFRQFSLAHEALHERMDAIREGKSVPKTILGTIVGGNYETYEKHWRRMQNVR